MEKFIIQGGNKINGEIEVSGSKNSILPILAATVLNDGISIINNCPKLKDVEVTLDILRELGCKVEEYGSTTIIDSSTINNLEIPEKLVQQMRCSIIFLGALLSRFRKVTISYPGE